MQSSGVPAIGLHLSRISSVTAAFAASRPPASIASATGRISSCVRPAHSSSVSAAPWMFCTLLARYMPAISRAPSRPRSRSSSIEATIVQPRSSESGSRPAACDLLADVPDERGGRDRRRQQPVRGLRRRLAASSGRCRRSRAERPSAASRRRRCSAGTCAEKTLPSKSSASPREHAADDLRRLLHRRDRLRPRCPACRMKIFETPRPR